MNDQLNKKNLTKLRQQYLEHFPFISENVILC